jgi:hypothetical protein
MVESVLLIHGFNVTVIEQTLIHDMLDGYNPLARPARHQDEAVQVDVSLAIYHMDALDAKHQTLSFFGWIYYK